MSEIDPLNEIVHPSGTGDDQTPVLRTPLVYRVCLSVGSRPTTISTPETELVTEIPSNERKLDD